MDLPMLVYGVRGRMEMRLRAGTFSGLKRSAMSGSGPMLFACPREL
jgi:hypothetical protein